MKKILPIVAYWIVAMLVTALILLSLDYHLWQALIMSLTFLPSAMALSFFLPKVDRHRGRRQRILDTVYIVLGVMAMAFMLIYLLQMAVFYSVGPYGYREWELPSMLGNPVFIAAILALLAYGNYLLMKWLEERYPSTRPITFNSEHRKVSLKKEYILYVEGQSYRNRNGISQWENLLGEGFLRIHRAFLVNVSHATLSTPDTVLVDGKELPVSRKNKETVKAVLGSES